MYSIFPTKAFSRKAKKILRTKQLQESFKRSIAIFEINPFAKGLFTHKVQSRKYGLMYSSKVTGDIRLIWNFDENNMILILLFDIGGHEGARKVYN